jgi:hypothetical protein
VASFNKFHCFVEDVAEKKHNLGSDTLKVYLSNAAPSASSHVKKADIAEISTGNGYTGPLTLTVTGSSQSGGTYTLAASDPSVITASGAVGPFQYVVLYNDTATNDEVIGWWDYGSAVTLASGETFTIDLGASVLTLA